jgi:hypothetical protein
MLQAGLLFDEMLRFRLQLRPAKPGKPVKVGAARVTPFDTTHLDSFRARFGKKYRNDFSAHCFLIEAGGRRIGHSADLGRPEDLEPLLQRPLDLLVCELAHFPPEKIFSYLRGRGIGRVIFVHLNRACWENLGRTRRLAAKLLPDTPCTFARDGAVIEL